MDKNIVRAETKLEREKLAKVRERTVCDCRGESSGKQKEREKEIRNRSVGGKR